MVFKKRKNALFHIAAELYNTAVLHNRILTPDEIEKAFKNAPYELLDIDVFLKEFMREDFGKIGFGMFAKTNGGFKPVIDAIMPALVSRDETAWLKTMLNDDKIGLFLDNSTQKKLNDALKHVSPLYGKNDVYIQKNTTRQDFSDENLQYIFRTVLRSITEKNIVRFEYHQRNSTGIADILTAMPLKIYYHGVNDSFQCIVYDVKKKNKSTLNMERITNVTVIKNAVSAHEKIPEDKIETAQIELLNEKNLPTQCFMLLSDYKKKVIFDDERNLYKITIWYYEFERQDLLKNLLSLGFYCKILAPQILVEQIKKRLGSVP